MNKNKTERSFTEWMLSISLENVPTACHSNKTRDMKILLARDAQASLKVSVSLSLRLYPSIETLKSEEAGLYPTPLTVSIIGVFAERSPGRSPKFRKIPLEFDLATLENDGNNHRD